MSKQYTAGISKVDSRFSRVVDSHIRKSKFNRDQIHKTTFNAGKLVPIFIDEILPGDYYKVDLSFVARMQANITCPLDDVELDFYFFFVPRRLTWNDWQRLHGENNQSSWVPSLPPPLCPVVQAAVPVSQPPNMIGDYYGISPSLTYGPSGTSLNNPLAEPFRGYGLIWNRWFRDQNYQAPIPVFLGGDENLTTISPLSYYPNQPLLYVNKKHDYFTSCLPATLKPISSINVDPLIDESFPTILNSGGSKTQSGILSPINSEALWRQINGMTSGGGSGSGSNFIQQLRTAWQLTKLLERDARGGTRYVELIKAHFNVDAQDYRLQYPEFLGHFHSYVHKQQVAQTSSTDTTSPQANISAFSITSNRGSVFSKSFVEHGFLHGFVVARQRKTYQQGVERFWFKRNRFDYFYPELSNITEQPVYQREIFGRDESVTLTTFGIQEAWADYRFKPNRISGEFRSGVTNSSDVWHYADYYANVPPVMSAAFVQDNSDVNIMRTLAVQDQHQFLLDCKVHVEATRCMPTYSIPGFVDHF